MTRDEFAVAQRLQLVLWPHARQQASVDHLEIVYQLWAPLDAGEVEQALKALAAEGREFAPPPGVVVAKVAERQEGTAAVSFDAVLMAFELANRLGAFHEVHRPGARAEFERRVGPDVAAFVERHYRDYAMSGGPQGDPVGVVRGQLRALWEQGQARRQSDAAHALAGVAPVAVLRRADAPQVTDGAA
ncbi:MAG: hypothetical protein U0869_21875 [Chloroflexota bacterium]